MIATETRPIETEDDRLLYGIAAILRAIEDARQGKLLCVCEECLAR